VGIGNMKDLFRQLDRSPGDAPKGGVGPGVRVRDDAGRAQQRREPANQANYLADAMGIAAETNRVPLFIWYVMTDPSEAADRQSGLLTATGAAKPSYFMYQRPVSPGTSVASKAGR
jgi:hypothetical protein